MTGGQDWPAFSGPLFHSSGLAFLVIIKTCLPLSENEMLCLSVRLFITFGYGTQLFLCIHAESPVHCRMSTLGFTVGHVYFFLVVSTTERRASCILGKFSPTEQPGSEVIFVSTML